MRLSEIPEYAQCYDAWLYDPYLTAQEQELLIEQGTYLGDQRCDWLNHKITDEGYGGPESGCIDLQCSRCGWNHHVTLY